MQGDSVACCASLVRLKRTGSFTAIKAGREGNKHHPVRDESRKSALYVDFIPQISCTSGGKNYNVAAINRI